MGRAVIRLILALILFTSPALADEAVIYAPETCEFNTAFPSEPTITKRCNQQLEECYEQAAYNHYSDTTHRISVRVICAEIGEDTQARYTKSIMETTVRAMARRKGVAEFELETREDKQYRQTGLVGQGGTAESPRIFIAQLWIGETSSLSVEAELVGENNVVLDQGFRDILQSIGLKAIEEESTPEGSEDVQP